MNIKITADSTCDLSKELMEENNIETLDEIRGIVG